MSIDPDRHCIRTVGSTIDACDVAKFAKKTTVKNRTSEHETERISNYSRPRKL